MWNYINDDKNTCLKIKEIEYERNYKIVNCYIDITELPKIFDKIIYGDDDIILGNLKKNNNENLCNINLTYYNFTLAIPYYDNFIYKKYKLFPDDNSSTNENYMELSEMKYEKIKILKIKIYIKK